MQLVTRKNYETTLARIIHINSQEDVENAAAHITRIKLIKADVEKAFNPIITQAHKAHKEALAQRARYLEPLQTAERNVKQKIAAYLDELQRIEAEKRRAQEAMIRKHREDESRALAKAALAKAAELELQGKNEQAEAVVIEAQNETIQQEAEIEKRCEILEKQKCSIETPKNISTRKIYKFRITNRFAISPDFLIPDEASIRKIVNASKKEAEKIVGGIEVYEEMIIASRY